MPSLFFSPNRSDSPQGQRPASASASASNGSRTKWKRHGTALPGWRDLERDGTRNRRTSRDASEPRARPGSPRPSAQASDNSFLERVSTLRFTLLILGVAALFTLYVGHVHATQRLLADLQEAKSTQHVLRLKHNRLKGAFDQKTGPAVIYERARALGLEENVTYGPNIPVAE